MMAKFKSLQFNCDEKGQIQKNEALQRELAQGWEVVSESIINGKFKGEKACCLFLICAPLALLAGSTSDKILVTLKKDD